MYIRISVCIPEFRHSYPNLGIYIRIPVSAVSGFWYPPYPNSGIRIRILVSLCEFGYQYPNSALRIRHPAFTSEFRYPDPNSDILFRNTGPRKAYTDADTCTNIATPDFASILKGMYSTPEEDGINKVFFYTFIVNFFIPSSLAHC